MWDTNDISKVPYSVFTDKNLFRQEFESIFKGPTWNFVGLEAELANPHDYKTTTIGATPVVASRDKDGQIHVVENRCTHRGTRLIRNSYGNRKRFNCIYHQWGFAPSGELKAIPFKNGVCGQGGLSNFNTNDYGLKRLHVKTFNGLIFASFHVSTPDFDTYLGSTKPYLERIFNGRNLEVLGSLKQRVNANWKLYFENTKDPYHAGLLHPFVATFGLFRTTQKGQSISEKSGTSVLVSYKDSDSSEKSQYLEQGIDTFKPKYRLLDPKVVSFVNEFEDNIAVCIHSIFPNLVVHQIGNTLATRQITPLSHNAFELCWTFFGFETDTKELRQKRICQANLVGPSGYVSLEDVEALHQVQAAIEKDDSGHSVLQMGGTGCHFSEPVENLVDESAIRGFWHTWRNLMGI